MVLYAIREWLKTVKKIMTGEMLLQHAKKLEVISFMILLIHMIMVGIFIVSYVPQMVIYNLIVVLFYLYVFNKVAEGKITLGYILIFFEICVQVIFGTIMQGWGVGYYFYLISMVPVFYQLNLNYDPEGEKKYLPVIWSLAATVVSMVAYAISLNMTPILQTSAHLEHILFVYNFLIAVFGLSVMTHLFIIERQNVLLELTRSNRDLGEKASVDPLTGLSNRRSMELMIENAEISAKSRGIIFSFVMGDIDNFKKINDTYGHDSGDVALVKVAEAFRRSVRGGDCICRWGGEEFLILVAGNRKDATMVAERIRTSIEKITVKTERGEEIRFTMTFGVATYKPGYSVEQLIQQADENLYIGKRSGKNQVVSREPDQEE